MVDRHVASVLCRYIFVSPESRGNSPPASACALTHDRYVAMHAMQEDGASGHEHHSSMNGYSESSSIPQRKQAKPQMRDTLATVVGMLLPLLTQFGHHH